ncbi:MAG TPA: hypothetical protein VER79_12080 [Candidatus Limnocylindrales bacterium]|nr:hypothetical protein [Candidatus Limnocylindrales bacterium]
MNLNSLKNLAPVRWANVHPRLAAWIVLSAGMIILLVLEAQNVGLLVGQWIALIVAVIMVAGVCVWIISWEDDDETPDAVNAAEPPASQTPVVETVESVPQADSPSAS